MKRTLNWIFILLGFIFAASSYANEGPLRVRSRAWPTKVTLGDEIKLMIKVDRPRGYSISPPTVKTPVPPFEIKSVDVSSYREDARSVSQTYSIKLTVFQLGDLQIPPLAISYKDAGSRSAQEWTDPIKIKVSGIIKGSKEKVDIRPIKGPISLDMRRLRDLTLLVLAFLLTLFLIIKVILRRRHKRPLDPESLKPAHERAILELGRLEAAALLGGGKVKEFYSELADILRRYLDRRFQMETLELTTFEILKNLKDKEFDAGLIEKIKELLENSDLAKFAKYLPPRTAAEQMTALLKDVVEKTIPQKEETEKK